MGTQRWSCDGHIPNVTLHLGKLIKTDNRDISKRYTYSYSYS